MTMRSFGKVMPIHIDMLRLAGYEADWDDPELEMAASDDACLREMRAGREALRTATGQDFGYDLVAWRTFLLAANDDEFGYRHPYAFKNVDQTIRAAIRVRRRQQLAAQLEAAR